jgi:hypothetical protein
MNSKALFYSLAVSAAVSGSGVFAQAPAVQFPSPSPTATLKQRVGLTDIELIYSRPGVKGRQIFGGLVPYGEVWRTGANQATKIIFSTDVKLNGSDVPAGTYGLFTIPGEKEWTVAISKGSAQWGSYRYDEKDDVVRFKVTPVKLADSLETFTIDFNDIRDDSATLNVSWDKTRVPIKLQVDLKKKLVSQIEEVMSASGDRKPYFQAAMFYYDHDVDLKKASKWVDAAIAEREAHYIVHLKAKILAKLGDKPGALAAAKQSTDLAVKAKDSGYVKLNEDLIASLK